MRAAPPVSVRCSGGWMWPAVQMLLFSWATAAAAVWALQRLELTALWAVVPALLATAMVWFWMRPRTVDLVWDGRRWTANGVPGRLDVVFDLGLCLLLRLKPDGAGPARWIPLLQSEVGAAMHGLRVAAYSPVPQNPTGASDAARGSDG